MNTLCLPFNMNVKLPSPKRKKTFRVPLCLLFDMLFGGFRLSLLEEQGRDLAQDKQAGSAQLYRLAVTPGRPSSSQGRLSATALLVYNTCE